MTFPDDYFGILFQMNILDATNSYFPGGFLFQPIIRLIGPATDWYRPPALPRHNLHIHFLNLKSFTVYQI